MIYVSEAMTTPPEKFKNGLQKRYTAFLINWQFLLKW